MSATETKVSVSLSIPENAISARQSLMPKTYVSVFTSAVSLQDQQFRCDLHCVYGARSLFRLSSTLPFHHRSTETRKKDQQFR